MRFNIPTIKGKFTGAKVTLSIIDPAMKRKFGTMAHVSAKEVRLLRDKLSQ